MRNVPNGRRRSKNADCDKKTCKRIVKIARISHLISLPCPMNRRRFHEAGQRRRSRRPILPSALRNYLKLNFKMPRAAWRPSSSLNSSTLSYRHPTVRRTRGDEAFKIDHVMLSEAPPCLSDVKGDWIFDMPETTQAANLVSGLSRDCLSGVAIAPVRRLRARSSIWSSRRPALLSRSCSRFNLLLCTLRNKAIIRTELK
jgi:hypothetical protein